MKLARRKFLHLAAGAAAGSAITARGSASAQPDPPIRAKGPVVWLDMDQKELDDAYDQFVYAPNARQVIARCHRNSELVRERLGAPKRLVYGPTSIEALDIYLATAANAPINVFVHGGAWRSEVAAGNASQAEMLVNAGAHLVVLDFNNVVETGGNLMTMADQIKRGVVWVYKNATRFGGNLDRIYISGHSSGGHWVGMLLTTDWQKEFGVPPTMIKGGVAGSGMFDLKPVRLSARRARTISSLRMRWRRLSVLSAISITWWHLSPSSTAAPRHRNFNGRAAILQQRSRPQANPCRYRSWRATTISRFGSNSPIPTACSGEQY